MLYALNDAGKKIRAIPKANALCPHCSEPVIAKCGQIVVWHWAHVAGGDCDEWSGTETHWHRDWKNLFDNVEVTLERNGKRHRADIVTPSGLVIELQHSSISPADIAERERFYKQMVWVFDAQDAYRDDRLLLRNKGSHITFRWKHPRRSIISATKSVYLDLDEQRLLKLQTMYGGAPCGGWGLPISRKEFVAKFMGT